MKNYKLLYDIFICGGSQHVSMLKPLLRKLQPYGKVHLGSCFFSTADLDELRGLYDALHRPEHSSNGYCNFEQFCIRDIDKLASGSYFIKLDADVTVTADWIDYVDECIAAYPDAVLLGPWKGNADINVELSGNLAREVLNQEVRVANGLKVIGGFYIGKTAFFKEHMHFMSRVHDLVWRLKRGALDQPGASSERRLAESQERRESITVIAEDTLRNLVAHATGAGDRVRVIDSKGRVQIDRHNTLAP